MAVIKGNFVWVLGLPFVKRSYTKAVPFLLKVEYKMTRGWTSGGVEPRRIKLC